MAVYSIGFTQKSAKEFFAALKRAGVRKLIDVRLNNSSQLAGFTKRDDLPFFLEEICHVEYQHEPLLTPTAELLDEYKKRGGRWEDYSKRFVDLMATRRIEERLPREMFATPSVLLCSEATAEHCHRRLVLEYLRERWGDLHIVHL